MASDFFNILTYIFGALNLPFELADMDSIGGFYLVAPTVGFILLFLALVIIRFIVKVVRDVG